MSNNRKTSNIRKIPSKKKSDGQTDSKQTTYAIDTKVDKGQNVIDSSLCRYVHFRSFLIFFVKYICIHSFRLFEKFLLSVPAVHMINTRRLV